MVRPVRVKELESTLGRVISVTLAVPTVRLWCRSLYGHLRTEQAWTYLSTETVSEMKMLLFVLGFRTEPRSWIPTMMW